MSAADPPTELADFTPPLAAAVARTLREHGVEARVDAAEPARVLVPGSQRDAAVALMAAHMEQIRGRSRAGHDETSARGAHEPTSPPPSAGDPAHQAREGAGLGAEPASRPLVTERLRGLWPLALLLIPLVGLLGPTRVPVDLALLVLVGGMTVVLMLRQRRRR